MPAHRIYLWPVRGSSPHQALQDFSPAHAEVATISFQLCQASARCVLPFTPALGGARVRGQINK